MVQTTNNSSLKGIVPKPEDIVFVDIEASWVHHPHEDALVITAKKANNLIHRVLVDSGSAVSILYWSAYQKIELKWTDLHSTTSSLYEFTGESVIPEGTIRLAITLGEAPRMATTVIDFLVINCPSTFNGVLGKPLLRILKAVTSIHCLTIKFFTTARISQVRGRQ